MKKRQKIPLSTLLYKSCSKRNTFTKLYQILTIQNLQLFYPLFTHKCVFLNCLHDFKQFLLQQTAKEQDKNDVTDNISYRKMLTGSSNYICQVFLLYMNTLRFFRVSRWDLPFKISHSTAAQCLLSPLPHPQQWSLPRLQLIVKLMPHFEKLFRH